MFAAGTVPIDDDGTLVTTPGATTDRGRLLQLRRHPQRSALHRADAVSPVGRPDETFSCLRSPSIATSIDADGYSDDVTISGTVNFDGDLAWTLFGPVALGPDETCDGANWNGAAVFASGTTPIDVDGTVVTTRTFHRRWAAATATPRPSATQLRRGRESAVGQSAETFFVPFAPPTIDTAISADGYSDDVTITGTEGLTGTLEWTLFGPVALGPGGTCDDADWTDAPAFASGTVPVSADGAYVTTPDESTQRRRLLQLRGRAQRTELRDDAVSDVGHQRRRSSRPFAPPTIDTAIDADGYSDEVTITGTQISRHVDLDPVRPGRRGCRGPVTPPTGSARRSSTRHDAIDTDGTFVTTPAAAPTEGGCYSYADSVSGPRCTRATR